LAGNNPVDRKVETMKVQEIMSTSVQTVEQTAPVAEVARIMALKRVAGVPVMKEGVLVGVVSEKDILRAMYPSYKDFTASPVNHMDFEEMEGRYAEIKGLLAESVMTNHPVTVSPETPILKAASLMILRKVRRLPVVDGDGRLVGIVSQGDVHMAVFEKHFLV
jgi:CBS domain-containing protein